MYHFFKNNKTNKYFVYFLVLSFFNSGYFAYSNQLLKNYIKVKWNPQAINHYVGNAQPIINPTNTFYNEVASKTDIKNEATAKVKFVNSDNTNMVYASDIKEGNIGISKKGDFDFIYDNIFKVNINDKELAGKEIYLSYDIKGIDKSTLPSRSINFNKVVGGYVVKFSNEWQNVEEKMSAAWLKNGVNTIFFTLPNEAVYNYKIKNLKIFTKAKSDNHIIELKNLIAFKNDNKNIYLNGFINLPSQLENSGYTLTANDKPVTIIENQFEEKFANVANKEVVLKLFQNNLVVDIIEVKAAQFIKADRNYNVEPLDAKTSVASNVVAAKNYAEYESKKHAIAEVRLIDIPQFESSFINVTKNKTAYRVTNLKVKDSTAFKLFMEYDATLIPNGYTEKDIQTFHFDADYKKWIPVEKDSMMVSDNVIVALSDKDGDYVNGIIQVPESPQTSSYTPTMMSDIKAADPSSGMTLISPPEVSQKGEANISYPIKIPAGRNGVQPNISINYSSDGGNGWLGEGWGINIPAITIDTKWGVPTFDPINESEIYNLNGEQLMYPKSNNGEDWMPNRHQEANGQFQTTQQIRGILEKQFSPRKQGSFTKIERLGNTTSNYTWKVTSTDGTVSWYGGKNIVMSNAVIKNAQNNIVHWALYMVEDVNGNNIVYEYDNYYLSGQTLDNINLNDGKIFQIKNIFYTGFNGSLGNYKVEFVPTTTIRANPIINAKSGVKQVDVFLLDNIKVSNNNQLIRNYKFYYNAGRFNKTLLESVAEFDNNDVEFYKHKFEYYDDLKPAERKSEAIFDEPISIDLPALESPTPSFSLGYGLLGASRMNTTQTIEAGWEISPAIGLEIKLGGPTQFPKKTLMFSLPFGASYPRSRGIISMADMDGNGLDDIIYKHANGLSYRPCFYDVNTSQISYGNVIAISGIDAFHRGFGTTQNKFLESWGIDFTIPFTKNNFHLGSRRFVSKNFTDVYFTDGNGDGLVDIVKNNNVVFNQGINQEGFNTFSSSSLNTPNLLITAQSDTIPAVPVRDEITDETGYEPIRVWVAPKAGVIQINDVVNMVATNSQSVAKYSIETSNTSINNGIPFRLYFKELTQGTPNANVVITNYGGTNYPLPSYNSGVLNVERGQRIYFRLIYKEQKNDVIVYSNPIIEYINPPLPNSFLKDENQINHLINKHENGFLLNDNQVYSVPSSGNVKIEWQPISINSVSDNVIYKIIQITETNDGQAEQEEIIYQKTIPFDLSNNILIAPNDNEVGGNVSIPFHVDVCPYVNSTKPSCNVSFKFEVYSDSNQKWKDIQWKPKLTFVPDVITNTNNTTVRFPIAYHSVYKSTFVKKMAPVSGWNTPNSAVVYGIIPKNTVNIGAEENGIFNMVLKRNGQLVGKTQISIIDGNVYSDNSPIFFDLAINIYNTNSQFEYTVGFYTEDKEDSGVINKYLLATNNAPVLLGYDFSQPQNSNKYLAIQVDNCFNSLRRFGTMYKEWGQFFYNDDFDNTNSMPSDGHGKLLKKELIDENYSINQDTFGTFSECDQFQCEGCTDAYIACTSNAALNNSNIENADINNISDTPNNPIFNEINPAFLIAMPTRNYVNNIENEKWIGVFDTQFTSETQFKPGSFSGSAYDTIFPDEEAPQDIYIQADLQTGMPAITKLVESSSISKNLGWTNPDYFMNATISKSNSRYSEEVYSFMDINGDAYPEILSSNHIKYTNKWGGFFNSIQHNFGVVNATENVGYRLTSNSLGEALGRSLLGKNGKNTNRGNAFSSLNISIPIDVNFYNNNKENLFWIDLNGDGLADRVKEVSGDVLFSLGTGNLNNANFLKFSLLRTNETKPNLLPLNLGVSIDLNTLFPKLPLNVEVSSGYSNQGNTTKTTFVDITGDGLVDLLNVNNNQGTFHVNTGNGFSSIQTDLNYIAENKITLSSDNNTSSLSIGGSISKFYTIISYLKWPKFLKIFNIKAGLTVSGNANLSLSHANKSFKDFNGDGFVDYIERDGNNLKVYYSRIKRTNKLKMVTNPLGGTFTVDYKPQPVTFDNPHAKWAMTAVTVNDGRDLANDGADVFTKSFVYSNGKYDRRERAFYGYETVEVNEVLNTTTSRKSVTKYHNKSYFLEGLVKETAVYKVFNSTPELYSTSENTYEVRETKALDGTFDFGSTLPLTFDVGGKEGRRQAGVLLTKSVNKVYEFGTTPITSEIVFKYDGFGRVEEYTNKGDISNPNDDYKSVINYHSGLNNNLINIPKKIEVFTGPTLANLVRQREITNVNTNTGAILTVKTKLNSNEYAQTDMTYDVYGNLKTIAYPQTSFGQMTYNYTYDTTLNKYLIEVKDAFGYKSSSTYDYNFDVVLNTTDRANNVINYQYDNIGRLTKIIAPKEAYNSDPYTISFQYMPTYSQAQVNGYGSFVTQNNFIPFAVTKHYDTQHPTDPIETINFIDGLGKNIQVKKDIEVNTGSPQEPNYEQKMSVSGYVTNDVWGRAIKSYQPRSEDKNNTINFLINQAATPNTSFNLVEYDVLDRTTKTIDMEGNESVMSYTIANDPFGTLALKTKSQVQQNNTTLLINESFTDIKGQNISTLNAGSIKTKFDYDAIGQLMAYTDDQNINTTYKYDVAGRKTQVTHPDSGTTKYQYDEASNLTKVQTANLEQQGTAIEYYYDINRVSKIRFPEVAGVANVADVTYEYGLPNIGNSSGRLIEQNDATGKQVFTYGVMGETTLIDRTIKAPNLPTRLFSTRFSYDSFNRIQNLTYPDGEIVTYSYNKGGNLNKMTTQLNGQDYEYVKQIDYDYFEQKTYMKYGNNTETFYNYSQELRRLQNLNVTTADGQSMFNNVYAFDKVGNITKITNEASYNTTNYLGGTYNHNYAYDNLNRLSRATGSFSGHTKKNSVGFSEYNLDMEYNTTHGITQKKQFQTAQNGAPVYQNSYTNGYEYMPETHKVASITNAENSTTENFEYDANGNTIYNHNQEGFRKMYWDESNRLRVVNDNDHQIQHYIYDGAGERILKASSQIETVYENGQVDANTTTMGLYTTYVSPYMVVDANQKYSKHYFNGTQRVASKIGEQDITMFDTNNPYLKQANSKAAENTPSTDFDALKNKQITDFSYYLSKNGTTTKNLKVNYTEYKKADTNTETTSAKAADNNSAFAAPQYAEIYYYHSDHLGTGTFLSDFDGNPYQFFLNLPFGETMAEQHSYSGEYTNRYKFNGKELDEETGFYYYGARYYNPKFSIWLSVDPLAEKAPNWTPYRYCFNNPIRYTDPTGLWEGDYYTKDGEYLGWDGKNDGKVYVANKHNHDEKTGKNTIKHSDRTELKGVSNEILLGFASLIHAESGGSKDESYAIGNVTMNFIDEGGSSQLKTLEDVAMYDNRFAQGATQENFSSFLDLSYSDRNSKYAVGAAINAIGNSQGLAGYSDYSNGADSWDGIDLISSKWSNNHRNYSWSEGSKSLLNTFKTNNNGGVDVSAFTYKKTGFDISATKIIGKTLFTNLNTGRGEKKQSTVRFNYKL